MEALQQGGEIMLRRKKVIQTLDDKDESVPPDFAKLLNKNYRLVSALFAWDRFKSYYKDCNKHPDWLQDDLGGWLDGLPQDRIHRILDGRCSLKATYEFDIAAEEARVRKLTAQLLQHIRTLNKVALSIEYNKKEKVRLLLDSIPAQKPRIPVAELSFNAHNETYKVVAGKYRSVIYGSFKGHDKAKQLVAQANADLQSGNIYVDEFGELRRRKNEDQK